MKNNFRAVAIHGDKSQRERDFVLNKFRQDRQSILIATDVASLGLDVDDVKFVINYDFPGNIEDYVHRIGRTGRSNNKGTSYTFFTHTNGGKVDELINILQETNQYVNPELYQLKRFGGSGNSRRGGGGGQRYNQQHGTFKKGSFGQKGGYGQRYDGGGGGGGFKKNFDGYGASSNGASGSRFSDRKFEGGEGSRNGQSSYASGHTRFN